jgi:hypothetical protein
MFIQVQMFSKCLLINRRAIASGVGFALVTLSPGVAAQELAKQGAFSATYTVSGTSKTTAVGKDRAAYTNEFMMVLSNDAGKGFLHNMTARCIGFGLSDATAGTRKGTGYCTFVDADKDQIFEEWEGETSGRGSPFKGKAKWLGGTGKYTGMEGIYDFESTSLIPAAEGTFQAIGKKRGSYKLP